MDKKALLDRFDAVLARGKATVDSAPRPSSRIMENHVWVDESLAAGFTTAGLSLLLSMFGKNHYHFKNFHASTFEKRTIADFKRAHAIIDALRDEVANDWLFNTRALIAAEVFGDILEMAKYLLAEGYKDASAVLIGSSLESHLRRLCPKYDVDTHYDDKGKLRPQGGGAEPGPAQERRLQAR